MGSFRGAWGAPDGVALAALPLGTLAAAACNVRCAPACHTAFRVADRALVRQGLALARSPPLTMLFRVRILCLDDGRCRSESTA